MRKLLISLSAICVACLMSMAYGGPIRPENPLMFGYGLFWIAIICAVAAFFMEEP